MFAQAGCAARFIHTGHRLDHRAALLQAGRHLRDGVSPDAADSAPRTGVSVVLHYGGQQGDVVALGSYHCRLVDDDVPGFGGPGVQQMLFWKEDGMKGDDENPRAQTGNFSFTIPNGPEDPSLEHNP